jgi:AcrR family transcriptional regulator
MSPPKVPQTNQQIRAESLERLYQAGLDVLSVKGYKAASLEELARAAGLTKGAIHFYFKTKDNFVLSMLERISSEFVDAPTAAALGAGSSAQARLVTLLHSGVNYAQRYTREVKFFVLMAIELQNESGASAELLRIKYKQMRDTIGKIVRAGRRSGEFSTKVGVREFTAFYMSAFDGMIMEYSHRTDELNGKELVRVLRRAVLAVLHD